MTKSSSLTGNKAFSFLVEMRCFRLPALFTVLMLVPAKADADIGVPMIFITAPGMLIALIPIVLIEGYVMSKQLAFAFRPSLKASFWGNIASTIVGIPVTWIILLAIQIGTGGSRAYGLNSPLNKFLAVTWQAPWLIPYEPELYWMIPAATLSLLVPFFFASWWIEYKVERRILKDIERAQLNSAVRNANLVSYGILFLIVLGFLIIAKPQI